MFTDAVVAIAITLLVLPLVDLDPAVVRQGFGVLVEHDAFPFLGFVISFFVIARLWWSHHRIFAHLVRWSGAVVVLDVLWLFTIVLLPVATAVTTSFTPEETPAAIAFYIGVMTASSGLLSALSILVLRRAELTDGHDDDAVDRVVGSVETTLGFLLAFVIGTLLPAVNYFALLVLVLTGRLDRIALRLLARRRAARRV